MPIQTTLSIAFACALASLGLFSLGRSNLLFSESSSSSLPSNSNTFDFDGRRGLGVADFVDPKSLERKIFTVADEIENIVPLNKLKLSPPTINIDQPLTTESQSVDVVSIGSEDKLEYMVAQSQTWAAGARHFWGFTEQQDFDARCATMDKWTTKSCFLTCRSPKLGGKLFGKGLEQKMEPGWYCAQRRLGRALGWLTINYIGRATPIPDILILVDDDTSVDVEKVKIVLPTNTDIPFIGTGSMSELGAYDILVAPVGGFGTFLNKAAIQTLLKPIFCGEQHDGSDFTRNACEKLSENQAGEANLFEEGDSLLEIFYKHASRPRFCMHSEWQIGYMIQNYSGTQLVQIEPQTSRGWYRKSKTGWCSKESFSCHYQTPKDMEEFVVAHPQIE